jgi:hypothetical protein
MPLAKYRAKYEATILEPGDPRHGMTGYTTYKCRCDVCRGAWRDWQRKYRARMRAKPINGDEPWHGTVSGYENWGCRCGLCSDVKAMSARVR